MRGGGGVASLRQGMHAGITTMLHWYDHTARLQMTGTLLTALNQASHHQPQVCAACCLLPPPPLPTPNTHTHCANSHLHHLCTPHPHIR